MKFLPMNLNQRIFLVKKRYQGKKYKEIKEEYESTFGTPCPTCNNITSLIKKFEATGSVLNAKKAGRPKNARISVDEIKEVILAGPRVSLRTHENELDIRRSTLQRIIRNGLRFKSYHLQVIHHLHNGDFRVRMEMCIELLRLWVLEDLKNNILFSDEAVFHVCGIVNRHNSRIWACERPSEFIEWETNTPKVNVWIGMTNKKIYGPYFFGENTINGEIYQRMLSDFLIPQLIDDGIKGTVVFQQDGAPCHYALTVRNYLDEQFPNRWIGRGGNRPWAPRSPDLTPLDFFVWGYIKSKIYGIRISDTSELKVRIREAVDSITTTMLENVSMSVENRFQCCIDRNGAQVELNR